MAPAPGGGAGGGGEMFGWRTDFGKRFRKGRELGRGQFGITYLVTELATGNQYASKTIPKAKLTSRSAREDVENEVAIMRALRGHANVVNLEDVYEDAADVHLVMEVCRGGELFDSIVARGHFSEADAAGLVRQMLDVVARCHLSGVIHRDLKPENFLFKDSARGSPIKATDFGLSCFFQTDAVFTEVVGSPYYVAPEVLRRKYGTACDIHSVGVIMYILLSGTPPFYGATEQQIFSAVLKGTIDLERGTWQKISESAKDLIRKMLLRDPKARLTASEALSHPWLSQRSGARGAAPNIPLDISVLNHLRRYAGYEKLKKVALQRVARLCSEVEVRSLKDQFLEIDTDRSGTISLNELVGAVKQMQTSASGTQVIPEDLVQGIMAEADADGDGQVDYLEFVAAAMPLGQLQRRDRARWRNMLNRIFDEMDSDKNGHVDMSELGTVLREWTGARMDEADIQEALQEVDQNGDGVIDRLEFFELFRTASSKRRDPPPPAASQGAPS